MIITCPSCSSRFAVKAEAIGIAGRKVRCAKCKHDWFQDPVEDAAPAEATITPEPTQTDPIPQGSNLPATIKTGGTVLYLKLAFAACLVLLLICLSIVKSNSILPHMAWYYSIWGISDDKGVALYDITTTKDTDKPKELMLKGRIVNDSKEKKKIPTLRITLLDNKYKKLRSLNLDSHGAVLEPGEGVNFENQLTDVSDTVAKIVMDIGNPVNLAAR